MEWIVQQSYHPRRSLPVQRRLIFARPPRRAAAAVEPQLLPACIGGRGCVENGIADCQVVPLLRLIPQRCAADCSSRHRREGAA